jgi:23S rRNA (cytosine1962-C5)-methyltransferase
MQPLLDAIATLPRPTEAGRHFHGRGGLHPGCTHLALDAFPPAWLLTSFEPLDEAQVAAIGAALAARWQQVAPDAPLCWVLQLRHGGRTETRVMAGRLPDPHVVSEDGLRYLVHLDRGQNHGLFLDMAEGRRQVRALVQARPGLRVLNLFAYTCAFSVVALQAGAAQVTNVDMSAGALAIGRRNHALNGLAAGAGFLAHDIFNSWGKLTRGGPYDLVVMDPPSHQKGSFVATKDYPRLLRRLPDLLAPGGHALLCLNAPELGSDFLRGHLQTEAPTMRCMQRLPNPPAFADAQPERALKVLLVQAPADGRGAAEAGPGPG